MEPVLQPLHDAILNGDAKAANTAVQNAINAGIPPERILTEGMVITMKEVGQLFEEGEYFVPEMLLAARAMKSGLAELKPRLIQTSYKPIGKVVIGTVKGDLHDIGKNLVGMLLEGAGFEINDLGTDVPPSKFVAAVQAGGVDIIALSSLLTTTMASMQTTLDALKTAGVRSKVKVIVGGAPVTEAYARQIGADGYSPDASSAAQLARTLVGT
jgi:5-methyltetrahydrofolate--homocysteine methyltransferase